MPTATVTPTSAADNVLLPDTGKSDNNMIFGIILFAQAIVAVFIIWRRRSKKQNISIVTDTMSLSQRVIDNEPFTMGTTQMTQVLGVLPDNMPWNTHLQKFCRWVSVAGNMDDSGTIMTERDHDRT